MDSLVAGALAGLCVDLSLYPIDTVKTRIQSKEGFFAAGGFKRIYRGLSAVVVGSVPGGATFFVAYDTVKSRLFAYNNIDITRNASSQLSSSGMFCQGVAAVCGESLACCVRTPVEIVKQQMQAGRRTSITSALRSITNSNISAAAGGAQPTCIRLGGIHYLFSGMPIMLMREVPFAIIQMSLYEGLKYTLNKEEHLQPYYYTLLPVCGAVSGGTAAFLTTPLDVIKTRIMLQEHQRHGLATISATVRSIVTEPPRQGDRFGVCQKFFRGGATRVLWISIGGSIFFGTYEFVKSQIPQRR